MTDIKQKERQFITSMNKGLALLIAAEDEDRISLANKMVIAQYMAEISRFIMSKDHEGFIKGEDLFEAQIEALRSCIVDLTERLNEEDETKRTLQ